MPYRSAYPSSTKARAKRVDTALGLLIAEVDGYGCEDMTHRPETRAKWWPVEEALERARDSLRRQMEK